MEKNLHTTQNTYYGNVHTAKNGEKKCALFSQTRNFFLKFLRKKVPNFGEKDTVFLMIFPSACRE